jgi:DNA invertase Pin-like site-specific DNA recombinase
MISKITATHLQRRAVIYLRQSTLKQVLQHTESTKRQYALRERAVGMGWQPESIEVVDEDLGRSGTTAEGRTGFLRLSEEVAHGNVGAIFALDVSRLARSSADWHRLLDLCGLADVVIVDEQVVYDPRDHNDRLLLGIKGTMSEAELTWMRLRLRGARISKARRGEHFIVPPVGYEWDKETNRMRQDPNEEVQRAIRLIFERFRIDRSAYGVARYFMANDLQVPARPMATREVQWAAPRPSRILWFLANPTFAGAYVYGRRQYTVGLLDGEVVRGHHRIPIDAWKIVHRDRHPAYISWEEFLRNQETLRGNRASQNAPERHGAPMKGGALLQGIVLCGKCGHRMNTDFGGKQRHARYFCMSPIKQGKEIRTCWSVAAKAIDRAIAEMLLSAIQPPEIEMGLAVVREAERQAKQLESQWRVRLERIRYEGQLAERRYKSVDPGNRIVARTLEREWEQKLAELEEVERRFESARRHKKVDLNQQDRARILALSRSLPRVWSAESTTMAERKNITRALIREVCLTPIDRRARGTRLEVLWQTGATSEQTIERQLPGQHTSPEAAALIRELVQRNMPATEIAETLNERSLLTATAARWTNIAVHAYCRHHGVEWPKPMPSSVRRPDRRRDGLYSIHGVAAKLGVTDNAVRHWINRGWIKKVEGGERGRPCWFALDDITTRRLEKIRDAHTRASSRTNCNRFEKGDVS